MKTLRYILIGLVAMAVVGLLCCQAFITKDLTGSNLLRAMLILAGLLLAIPTSSCAWAASAPTPRTPLPSIWCSTEASA